MTPPRTISTVIVEDERPCQDALRALLAGACPEVTIAAVCGGVEEALRVIPRVACDLLFLDIELPDGTGFDVLEGLGDAAPPVIFTTAHNEFAVQAMRCAAIDYLQKPVDADELRSAIDRARVKTAVETRSRQLRLLREHMRQDSKAMEIIALPCLDGCRFVELREIIHCTAQSNYTEFHLRDKTSLTVARTLKEYDELLTPAGFARVHHSHLINLLHIRRYVKGKGGMVVLADGSEVEVSERRRDEFLARVGL
jgi:two-component system, LytTR family, response regulator